MLDDGALIETREPEFSEIRDKPDPRAYYAALRPLDYRMAELAVPVVEAVVAAARPPAVLDLRCGYGINAALLRHDLTWEQLAEHYDRLDDVPTTALATVDEAFHLARLRRPSLRVVGLDTSGAAVGYALRIGLLADGWTEDLERADPSPQLTAGLADVGLVVCTAGLDAVGERTFDRLLRALPRPEQLWLALFVPRTLDHTAVTAVLDGHGLVTERLPGTFPQRRYADDAEQAAALHHLERLGVDPTGREADGWQHAECFLTRPAAQAAVPAAELLAAALPTG